MKGAPPGRVVGLRVVSGEVPPFGAILVLPSGKRYQVIRVSGKSIKGLMLKPDDPVGDAPVWEWNWAPSARNVRRKKL